MDTGTMTRGATMDNKHPDYFGYAAIRSRAGNKAHLVSRFGGRLATRTLCNAPLKLGRYSPEAPNAVEVCGNCRRTPAVRLHQAERAARTTARLFDGKTLEVT